MKKHNIREQSKILVEHILNKDYLNANDLLTKLVNEAEEDRESQVEEEFGFDDAPEGGEETPNDGSDDVQLDGSTEGISDDEANKAVDDAVEIACQINAKIISKLFDKVSALKQTLDNAGLDQDSRDFIKFDTSITYYSDKLQDLQGKTNPGVDQSKVEEALNKIDSAIEQLNGEIGGSDSTDNATNVASPEDVSEVTDVTDETSEEKPAETDESTDNSEETSEETSDASEETSEGGDDFDDLFA